MQDRMKFLMAGLIICAVAAEAHAHFLFIRINEPAEAGRSVEVFFSELAEAGDPRFIDKIAGAKLLIQESPGKFQPLDVRKAPDRLRAFLPANGAVSVHGFLEYGVLQREVSFLLRYYPRAISGDAKVVNSLLPDPHAALEIGAEVKGDEVALVLLQNGKPVPKAHFTTVDDDLANEELDADDAGRAVFKPGSPGHYCIYAKAVLPQSGEKDGKKYTEIREFATLAFHWPLVNETSDPAAVKMFQDALAARAAWKQFPGFRAKVSGSVDGRSFDGKANVAADGTLKLELNEEVATEWVDDQLSSLVMHRRASDNSDSSSPVLHFANRDEQHPLGRLLTFVGGQFASSYRVSGDQITVVNRSFGKQNMTITILENEKNADGQYLPRNYTVQYWDAKTGQLDRTETVQNRWTRVGAFDLPTEITVTTSSSSGLTVRSVKLSGHELLNAK